jgi:hypothetical protein
LIRVKNGQLTVEVDGIEIDLDIQDSDQRLWAVASARISAGNRQALGMVILKPDLVGFPELELMADYARELQDKNS